MLTPYPQRVALHNEVHARPYERLEAPLLLSHLALLVPDGDAARAHLSALLQAHHLPQPAADASYLSTALGGLRLRWEKHTEFQTYTFWRTLPAAAPGFDGGCCARISRSLPFATTRIHAASIASMILTTDTLVVEKKEAEPDDAGHGHGHGH